MNKTSWLPLAAVVLLLSPPVQASFEIYGTAHVSLDYLANGDPDPAHDDHTYSLTSEHSYLGLRGRESLDGALAAIWQVENTIDLDQGGWGPGRDTFVGIDTGVGSFLLGKHATPYRLVSDERDVFGDTRADYNAVIGSIDGASLFNNRADNTLLYQTPLDKRLRFALAYSTRAAGADDLPLTTAVAGQHALSTSLVFASGPLYLGFGYESLHELMGPGLDAGKARKFAFGWDFSHGMRVNFIWENARSGEVLAGGEVARDAYYLNLAQVYGDWTYKAAGGRLGALDSTPDSGATYLALGAGYAASARTEFYLLYATVMNDDAGQYGLQPDHDGVGAVAATGDDVRALSAGVVHRFDTGF